MGTVGLSFGSPTSGAGFDVSTTVSEIVGNLQNVETPWKTQLTSLDSQDTAISSLGTLFSNLSNDVSSLTDFQGILSQKEGSSSDTNVLTLTAADNTAIAGTHTVTVNHLAQTSSGFLAPVTSTNATVTGSITLAVGNGASQTITLSSNNTLAGLAAAINASGAGVTASVLTDSNISRLSLVSGTSGAGGQISILSNSISTSTDASLSYTGSSGSATQASNGSLTTVASASDVLSGTLSVSVGGGTTEQIVIGGVPSGGAAAHTFYTGSGVNTLAGLAAAIMTHSSALGITSNVVTNSDGSATLSITSSTLTTAGNLTVASTLSDTNTSLGYTTSVTGVDAALTIDGVALTSSSNTVANLIPGVTFQLLAPSTTETGGGLEQVQVVIANDNTYVESTVNQMVSDYNSLISAVNTQEGNDSSGNPEPLFGSPTLTLLQQQLLGGLNMTNPNGTLTPISSNTDTTLSGSMSLTVAGGTAEKFVIGAAPASPDSNTFYTGSGVNTLSGLADAINAADQPTTLNYTATAGGGSYSYGLLTGIINSGAAIFGSLSVQVGTGTAENIVIGAEPAAGPAADTIYTGSGVSTLSSLAGFINDNESTLGYYGSVVINGNGTSSLALESGTSSDGGTLTVNPSLTANGIGVTANVATSGNQQTLSLMSSMAGTGGALAVNSSISATSDTLLSYGNTSPYTDTTPDGGLIGGGAGNDVLSGSLIVQVGSGPATTILVPSSNATLAGLSSAINLANLGVTATPVESSNGAWSISLTSGANGSAGALSIKSSVLDTTNTSTSKLAYTSSSDINNLSSLGITVNNDGSMALDATSLDSVLNSDFSSVVGFFQNVNSWGQTFSSMLTSAGTSSTTGILALASSSNSTIESTLNAEVAREDSYISSQQTSLTAELNSANEIMQELPSQLQGVNELYSAITGYNQNVNG
ncbi:MAG: flagellar filament capping protein FliD [Terracidiphilus sp.]|jgi:flagellar hook-associated protein 2